jgi:hypothetical protein
MGNTCSGNSTKCLVLTQDYTQTSVPLNCKVDGERFAALAASCGVKDVTIDHDGKLGAAKQRIAEFGKKCYPGDTFVLFFAGHGMSVADKDGDEADGMDEALCFTDRAGQMTEADALTDDALVTQLTTALKPGVKVVIITDCCHSGTIGDLEKPAWKGYQAVAISACQDYQESIDTGAGGMLTGLILETLEDLVATSPTDNLTMASLQEKMEASSHYAQFSDTQQLNIAGTAETKLDEFLWPLVPSVGFSVDAFDNELGEGLLDPSQFTTRAAETKPANWQEAMVHYHNVVRAAHGAGPVEWDDELAAHAQMAADENCAADSLFHVHCSEYGDGQNGAMCFEGGDEVVAAHSSVRMWYDELHTGPYVDGMEFSMETGHVTQVLWKETTRIGAGRAGRYIHCNYNCGNMAGAFADNVQATCEGDVEEVMDDGPVQRENCKKMLEENADYLSYLESDEGAREGFLAEHPYMKDSGIAGM